MHLDAQNLFSDAQALTATANSTNHLDLQATATPAMSPAALKRDIGGGIDVPLLAQVVANFTGGTSVEVQVQVDDNAAFSSAKTVGSSGAIPVATLKAGYKFPLPVIPFGADERYMRLRYVVSGTPTAGAVTAGIVPGIQTNG
ncbi:Bbp16 family capsid cement protein [Paracoccus homiensis]|uniref:Uncharacterized protein n=1 Tax=Paracoccus homiensis TaxID=364199 RepID=A0A1I0GXT5_9RHOB|nr:hypothetical protein [Paracoccus homiensis]SET75158.1 hypothetical protein SAMN04489858_109101 [Paracoccus homiensis]